MFLQQLGGYRDRLTHPPCGPLSLPPQISSGYQQDTTYGLYWRADVAHNAGVNTRYTPVNVTADSTTTDSWLQYVPPATETLGYDADGNLTSDGRWFYKWDGENRLVRMDSVAQTTPTVKSMRLIFTYDGLSRRIRKKVTEGASTIAVWEAYIHDGWNMVLSVKLNPRAGTTQGRPLARPLAQACRYVWGPDLGSQPLARHDWQAAGGVRGLLYAKYLTGPNAGKPHIPVSDAMGNVTSVHLITNSGGSFVQRTDFVYDYDAFGKEIRSSALVAGLNPDSFPFHYSTKFTDGETGFNYYGYRYYDPANGRWPSRDPIEENGGVNLYGMVGNSCPNGIDRDGRAFSWGMTLAGGIFGGLAGGVATVVQAGVNALQGQDFDFYANLKVNVGAGAAVGALVGVISGDPSAALIGGMIFPAWGAAMFSGGVYGAAAGLLDDPSKPSNDITDNYQDSDCDGIPFPYDPDDNDPTIPSRCQL